ncbi:MAG: hypothetical protein V8T29_02640 [Oscillospiraceae bacterium]|nr:MAG: hypothetical protein BHW33_06745 [Firmicutes bacterium CAG:137_57_8]
MVWDGPADKAALPVDRGTLGGMAPPAGGMGEEPVWVAPVVWAGAAGVDGIPAGGYAGRCRRPGECSGYTWNSPA